MSFNLTLFYGKNCTLKHYELSYLFITVLSKQPSNLVNCLQIAENQEKSPFPALQFHQLA